MAESHDYIQLAMCRSARDAKCCAIDIPLKKMQEAIDQGVPVVVKHHLIEEDVYYGTYEYRFVAKRLWKNLEDAGVLPKNGARTKNLHLKCSTGEIYRTVNLYERIAKPTNRKRILKYHGEQALMFAEEAEKNAILKLVNSENSDKATLIKELKSLSDNYLSRIVARTAIMATLDDYLECEHHDGVKHPNFRRRTNKEKGLKEIISEDPITHEKKTIYLDDNKKIIRMMKEMAARRYGIVYDQYHACHVWAGTCYDPQCFSNFANVVLLPNSLASLSDYNKDVIKELKRKSYTLFKHWHPSAEKEPDRSIVKLPWLELPRTDQTSK